MAGWDDSIFGNLPGSPRRPKFPADNRSLAQTMFPVDPREVVGGLMNQATEGAGDLAAGAARTVGLPNPELLGHDVTGFLQSPTFGGGASPMHYAPELAMAAAPIARGAARTATEIATGARGAAAESDAATQAARAAQASPGQSALDRMTSGRSASATDIATGAGRTPLTAPSPQTIRNMPVDQGIRNMHVDDAVQARISSRQREAATLAPRQTFRPPLTFKRVALRSTTTRLKENLGGADWYDRFRSRRD